MNPRAPEVAGSAAPVHATPVDRPGPADGIALCMSGGGYRAMLFHLGALWRLEELGFLDRLDRVSSVSGGSITAGALAVHWKQRPADPAGRKTWFQSCVEMLRSMARTTIDAHSIFEGVLLPGTVADHVARAYNDHVFHGAMLHDLPDRPEFVINATNLQTGVLWRFTRRYMGDYRIGRYMDPEVPLSRAVAASSAFPPFLSPVEIALDPAKFNHADAPPELSGPEFHRKAVLTDGGVYDNLGLETAFKRYRTLLVSDGGGALPPDPSPHHDWVRQIYRVLNVIDNQVVSLRKRQLIDSFSGARAGTYWGIRSDVQKYQLPDALVCPVQETLAIAATPTRLAALSDRDQQRLIDWGYAICDTAMRRHMQPAATAPDATPYGTFRRAANTR